jgi:two-component system chemotaxis sensor kinase CheA
MLGQVVHTLPEEISGRLVQVLEEVVTRELKDSVMSMRAQQVSAVFQRMPRLVRELAAKTGKKRASRWSVKTPRSTVQSSSA